MVSEDLYMGKMCQIVFHGWGSQHFSDFECPLSWGKGDADLASRKASDGHHIVG